MLLCAVALLGLMAGCAQPWHLGQARIPDVKPLREERAQRAIADFERSRNQAEWEAAQLAHAQGQIASALKMIENLLRRDPRHALAAQRQLEWLVEADQLTEAQRRANLAREQFPDDPAVQRACALVFEARGEAEPAAACLRRAQELDPERVTRGDRIRTSTEQPISIENPTADELLSVDEVALSAELWKSTLAEALGVDVTPTSWTSRMVSDPASSAVRPASALEPLAELASLEPRGMIDIRPLDVISSSDTEGWLRQAEEALRAGREASARIYLERALNDRPGDGSWSVRVASLPLRHAQPALAAELAQRSLERHPDSAALHTVRGLALYRQQQYAAAQSALERSLYLDNAQPLAYFLLGCTLSKQGQGQAAEEFLRQARHLDARYR